VALSLWSNALGLRIEAGVTQSTAPPQTGSLNETGSDVIRPILRAGLFVPWSVAHGWQLEPGLAILGMGQAYQPFDCTATAVGDASAHLYTGRCYAETLILGATGGFRLLKKFPRAGGWTAQLELHGGFLQWKALETRFTSHELDVTVSPSTLRRPAGWTGMSAGRTF